MIVFFKLFYQGLVSKIINFNKMIRSILQKSFYVNKCNSIYTKILPLHLTRFAKLKIENEKLKIRDRLKIKNFFEFKKIFKYKNIFKTKNNNTNFQLSIFNFQPSTFNFQLLNLFKKSISTLISYILIYSQITFSFFITQSIVSSISNHLKEKYNYQLSIVNYQLFSSAFAYNEIIPPQNIKDNPVDHIKPDNDINNGNTHLDRTQNGTPMVNINNANNQGISANYYKDFNVNEENLIFNNHKGESVNTNLGGVVYGNPNFNNPNGREADIILNEITTNRVSNINGYVEIAGKRADLIIANPNGIMVSGAGFINTGRLSMITGSSLNPQTGSSLDSNGNFNPFLLTDTNKNPNAIIQVIGQNAFDKQGKQIAYNLGIDAQDVKYADLVSRVVKINGNIVGSDKTEVAIKTGNIVGNKVKVNFVEKILAYNSNPSHQGGREQEGVNKSSSQSEKIKYLLVSGSSPP